MEGMCINKESAGTVGYKKAKRKSPFAGQHVAQVAAEKAFERGVRKCHVQIKGLGKARDSAIKGISL
eukprot:Ihof_evm4s215 gene=Ihof_evmTU4s215